MYYPTPGFMNRGLHYPESHGHNTSTPARNTLGPSDFCPLSQATALAEPLVNPGPRIVLPNLAGDSTPTASSSTGEVQTPESEAELPTQALVGGSELTYYNHLEDYYCNNGWEVNLAFNPDFNPSSMVGF